jgi:hypothetical protein
MRGDEEPNSPIERYLDELVARSRDLPARALRHLIAEAEAHLRDDAEAAQARGVLAYDAEVHAVARFGSAANIAAAERQRLRTPTAVLLRQTILSGLLLGSVGAIAVGVSGLVAALIRAISGARVLAGVPASRALSASDCARWLRLDPGAHTCATAAASDWAAETVYYRLALGLLGVIGLVVVQRILRSRRFAHGAMLPAAIQDTIAVSLFAAAGFATLAMGVDSVVASAGTGSGQWLSAALVAFVAAAAFGIRLFRTVRNPVPLAV